MCSINVSGRPNKASEGKDKEQSANREKVTGFTGIVASPDVTFPPDDDDFNLSDVIMSRTAGIQGFSNAFSIRGDFTSHTTPTRQRRGPGRPPAGSSFSNNLSNSAATVLVATLTSPSFMSDVTWSVHLTWRSLSCFRSNKYWDSDFSACLRGGRSGRGPVGGDTRLAASCCS